MNSLFTWHSELGFLLFLPSEALSVQKKKKRILEIVQIYFFTFLTLLKLVLLSEIILPLTLCLSKCFPSY